jgi:hypothetical protein
MPDITYPGGPFNAMPEPRTEPAEPMHEIVRAMQDNRSLIRELEQQVAVFQLRLEECRRAEQKYRSKLAPELKNYGFQLAPENKISTGDYNPEREY